MKNQTRFLIGFSFCFILILAGCSSASTSTSSGASPQTQDSPSLPLATRLAIGTLKLEETDQAVTAEQAAGLLTLWQAYQALSNSDTTATVELDAVIKQIQAAMTPEQIQAIDDMQLTRQSMGEVLQSLGMDTGPGVSRAQRTPEAGQTFPGGGAGGPPGGMPAEGGGFPGGGAGLPADGGPGFGAQITPDATMQARFGSQASRISPMLLEALIDLLETKTQSPE
jgi:hypothetical protein